MRHPWERRNLAWEFSMGMGCLDKIPWMEWLGFEIFLWEYSMGTKDWNLAWEWFEIFHDLFYKLQFPIS